VALGDDRISVTSAGMNAMMLAMECIVGAGDNVVAVTPVWPNIFATAEIMGGAVRHLPLDVTPAGWRLDLDRLFAACDERTRAIYVATPGNPTGWVMSRGEQQAVLEFARKRGLWVVADEVYGRLVYGNPDDRLAAPSFLELAEPDDSLVVVNSFSKTWAMTGWRIGWMVAPARLTSAVDRLIELNTSGAQPFLQRACVVAIEQGEPFVAEMVGRYRAGRDLVLQRLGGMRKVHVVRPEAAYYVMFAVDGMTDSLEFAKRLVHDSRVGLAPGSAFGPGGEGHLRLCFASSTERLSQAMDRLEPILN
jgi:aspartate/methionine/tyrosine aminotransferase